jgi:hypothetical protein
MTPLEPDHLLADFGYDEEAEIKAAVRRVKNATMVSFERLATLWQQVRYLDRCGVKGALVECGVWRGGCAGLMALAHTRGGAKPSREVHLFDSFQGLPRPDRSVDGERAVRLARGAADGARIPIESCVASREVARRLLVDTIGYPADLVKIHEGWFQDTLPDAGASIGPIALLRLDGDWYSSTRVCLEQLYGKVSQFGVVVVDDYGHYEGCRKAVDEFLAGLGRPILLNHIDYTGRFWVKA